MSQVQRLNTDDPGLHSPIIKISNLRVEFRKKAGLLRRGETIIRAIDDVSLDINESEMLSLVGESGSGKTTIARCLLGLTTPTSGSILFMGKEVSKLRGNELLQYLKSVQMIFQDPFESLYPRFDVYTALSIPISQLKGEKNQELIRERVASLLKEVGLDPDETIYKLPHQLSGGERQRVSIAKSLASDPRVLIADEPITMLDASHRLNILNLLLALKAKRNLTILLITHDLASAKFMSERTAVMYRGKLVEIGPTDVILSKPHHPYTELIIQSTPRLRKQGTQSMRVDYGANIEEVVYQKTGCVFVPRCKYATAECKQVDPLLLEKTPSHRAACHNALNLG